MEEILDLTDLQETQFEDRALASKGKRLGNYLIDLIAHYIISSLVGGLIGILLVVLGYESIALGADESTGFKIFSALLGIVLLTTYYTICEFYFKGKTLGKLITKTRAVTVENQYMTFRQTLIRSLCRLIPFEALSFLGGDNNGWHDSMSKTKVIMD